MYQLRVTTKRFNLECEYFGGSIQEILHQIHQEAGLMATCEATEESDLHYITAGDETIGECVMIEDYSNGQLMDEAVI